MDIILAQTFEVEENGKKVERIDSFADVINKKLATSEYKGDDPRIEYYNTKGEVGFVERTEEDKKIAEKAGLHWDGKSMHAQDFLKILPKKVDAYQKQQALLKQKMAERKVK